MSVLTPLLLCVLPDTSDELSFLMTSRRPLLDRVALPLRSPPLSALKVVASDLFFFFPGQMRRDFFVRLLRFPPRSPLFFFSGEESRFSNPHPFVPLESAAGFFRVTSCSFRIVLSFGATSYACPLARNTSFFWRRSLLLPSAFFPLGAIVFLSWR